MQTIIIFFISHDDVGGMSCETQLCALYHDLVKSMESAKTTHAFILDLQKAFDKLPPPLTTTPET